MRSLTSLLFALFLLSACADRLSEGECANADWRSIGVQDGLDGAYPSKVEERAEQCQKFGYTLNRERYEAGRAKGVDIFCTPRGALDSALRGGGNIQICRPDDFDTIRAYEVGRSYEASLNRYRQAQNSLQFAERQISQRWYRIRVLRRSLSRTDDKEDRAEILNELDRERFRLDLAYDNLYERRRFFSQARWQFDRAEESYFNLLSFLEVNEPRDAYKELNEVLRPSPRPAPEGVKGEPGFPPL
ncbi:MAG: DUF2799 domain-containing protein [Pseudomonadota bacterium]